VVGTGFSYVHLRIKRREQFHSSNYTLLISIKLSYVEIPRLGFRILVLRLDCSTGSKYFKDFGSENGFLFFLAAFFFLFLQTGVKTLFSCNTIHDTTILLNSHIRDRVEWTGKLYYIFVIIINAISKFDFWWTAEKPRSSVHSIVRILRIFSSQNAPREHCIPPTPKSQEQLTSFPRGPYRKSSKYAPSKGSFNAKKSKGYNIVRYIGSIYRGVGHSAGIPALK